MNPIGAAITAVLALAALLLPRRGAALAVVAAVLYVTQGQQVAVAGFHFTTIRAVLLAAMIRTWVRKEYKSIVFNHVDKALFACTACVSLVSMLRQGTFQVVIYQLGCAYDIVLSYMVFRALIGDLADFTKLLGQLALVAAPFAGFMCLEVATHHNLFAAFGGVPSDVWLRNGHVRAMATFRCPITAGSFGATLAPLYFSLFLGRSNRNAALIGVVVTSVIVVAAWSSGPMMAYLAGLVALGFWPLRRNMQMVRRTTVVVLLILHMVMTSPVWFLIARVSDLIGGGGYHRAHLIDEWIKRFSTWWLMGTDATENWMPTMVNGKADITNEFILMAIGGGLLGLVLFVYFLFRCFQSLGSMMDTVRGHSFKQEWLLWGMGATLFAHLVNLNSVSYFDQMEVMWYFLLAGIAAVTQQMWQESAENAENLEEAEEDFTGTVSA